MVYDPEQSYRTAERLTDIASRVKQEEGKKLGLKEMRKLVPTTRWKILRYLYESKGDAQKAREQYYKPKPQTMLEYHPHFRRPEQPEDPSLDGKIKDSEEHRAWD